ncbi:hypothetical protein BJX70DRAFT_68520 [Aspergillus crustosus]
MPGTIEKTPLEVAIIGGGIIGVITAIGFLKRGLKVQIYEQSSSFREIGAGISFTANAIDCMERIDPGIKAALKKVATTNGDPKNPNEYLQYSDGYHQKEGEEPNLLFRLHTGYRGFEGCHRAHLLDELLKLLPEGAIECRKRLDRFEDEPGRKVQLFFEDGSTAEADAVIGCDGIKSRTRQLLLGEGHPSSLPSYTNKLAYRALVPMDRAIAALGKEMATNQRMHMGPKAHLLHFSVANHTLMNVVAFVSDPGDYAYDEKLSRLVTKDAVLEAFKDFGPTVRTITSLLPDEVNEWAIFDTGVSLVPSYAAGRVCLAGDAAHAAAPHHGAGAGVGVEDALALCHVIELVTTSVTQDATPASGALSAAFAAYERVRLERTHWFVSSSRWICDVYEWQDPEIGQDFDLILKEIETRSHKIWYFDFGKMLEQLGEEYRNAVFPSKAD